MTWFKRPYPLVETIQTKLIIILGFGIADVVEKYRVLYVSGIGMHISFVLALNYFLVPKIFTKFFQPERWSIWQEVFL
ncbi:hypothetical protein AAON49_14315 [Pseudotenacibaculum sp. MALMAid0570]|uniref:hypothetical protein n=1 Tax=Pseudotenacibaculum sp. MALMAid0570 TaxID=3143938 RepID=UPI0032DE60CB